MPEAYCVARVTGAAYESKRILDHFDEFGRLDLEKMKARVGWNPYTPNA